MSAVKSCSLFSLSAALAVGGLGLVSPVWAGPDAAQVKFFETEIRPLLAESCYECHGPDKQKGGLRLDHIDFIKAGGEDLGAAVTAKDVEGSPLMVAVRYEDSDLEMPPDGRLPEAKIELLRKWIAMGAPWPDEPTPGGKVVERSGEFTEEDRKWWAFQPVEDPEVPVISDRYSGISDGGQGESGDSSAELNTDHRSLMTPTPIDAFILAKLDEAGLKPSSLADRSELVRRVYFDLHGLPPTPEQVKAFVEDKRPDAWERLVDELLESPRYGERMAQHWLDLVRYAESDGYRQDAYRPDAWPYRDYVIQSFNDDKPYDQFVKEQLAGDEIDPNNPDVVIGTAFLRHGIYEYNQRDVVSHWQSMVDELTDVTGDVFLGLSVQCAHCHNHKFDPILQKDYYQLQAFFSPIWWPEDKVLATPAEKRAFEEQLKKWEAATVEPRKVIDDIREPRIAKAQKSAAEMFPEDAQAMYLKKPGERTSYEEQIAQFIQRQVDYERERFSESKLPAEEQAKLKEARAELAKFDHLKPKPLQKALVATDVKPVAAPTTFKTRKDGEQQVAPGFLSILDPTDAAIPALKPGQKTTGRRTVLAEWLTRPENPLTTRVIVNRMWQFHFGRGLAGTASDFGTLGERPTHLELLDWLTARFVKGGWKLKPLQKRMLMSEAYRRTARLTDETAAAMEMDPENRLLWRFSPVRLDAEQTRDAILAVSGELDLKMGGASVSAATPRRTIYTKKQRNTQDELLASLDAPPGFSSVPRRDATTTATQSLLLVNGDWPLSRARAMAVRLNAQFPSGREEALVREAYGRLFSREPSPEELAGAVGFVRDQEKIVQAETPPPPPPSSPVVDAAPLFGQSAVMKQALLMRPGSEFEKLTVATPDRLESEQFVVEAVIRLDSLFPNASVRTIASRWDNNKVGKGWSFGVTSEKSAYQPRNLIIQLSGDDFQGTHNYEVVPSDLRIPLDTPYYVAAVVSNKPAVDQPYGGSVTFYARDLSKPDAPLQSVTIRHEVVGNYINPDRKLCIGGRDLNFSSGWDGGIARVTLASGQTAPGYESPWRTSQPGGKVIADVTAESAIEMTRVADPKKKWAWESSEKPDASPDKAPTPRVAALVDLCHALLNSNEFFYLH